MLKITSLITMSNDQRSLFFFFLILGDLERGMKLTISFMETESYAI